MTEWRPCPGFPEYAVSDGGQVCRAMPGERTDQVGRLLTIHQTNSGYALVNLAPCRERKCAKLVHRLVCEAWHGPAPTGRTQVDHIDHDRMNNHPSNLRWVSRAENNAHRKPYARRATAHVS